MGLITNIFYYSFHPSELRSILQWLVLPPQIKDAVPTLMEV